MFLIFPLCTNKTNVGVLEGFQVFPCVIYLTTIRATLISLNSQKETIKLFRGKHCYSQRCYFRKTEKYSIPFLPCNSISS